MAYTYNVQMITRADGVAQRMAEYAATLGKKEVEFTLGEEVNDCMWVYLDDATGTVAKTPGRILADTMDAVNVPFYIIENGEEIGDWNAYRSAGADEALGLHITPQLILVVEHNG